MADEIVPRPPPVSVRIPYNVIPYNPSASWRVDSGTEYRARYMRECVVEPGRPYQDGSHIIWPPSPPLPPFGTPMKECVWYAQCQCVRVIKDNPGPYYFGVTRDPWDRYWGPHDDGHDHCNTYGRMYIVAQSTNLGIIHLETELVGNPEIGRERYRCKNVGPGGEGVSKTAFSLVPYFLYIVIATDRAPEAGQITHSHRARKAFFK